MKFFYTYALFSHKDKNFYSGWTLDLRQRFSKHQSGKVYSTKNHLPLELIYYEACKNKDDARSREKFFKFSKKSLIFEIHFICTNRDRRHREK